MANYQIYHYTNKPELDGGKNVVCAVSTYAGKTVRGYAKCDPRDEFDMAAGENLAKARCNAKVAEKRLARARRKFDEAQKIVEQANKHLSRMTQYLADATTAISEAGKEVNEILEKLN